MFFSWNVWRSRGGPHLEMRYHLFRSSLKKSLLIADSQTRDLEFPNINILNLPGAKVNDVQRFIPPKGKYELIAIFVGGNDLYNYCLPSESSVEQVAERICALADQLFLVTESVFVLAVPSAFQPEGRLEPTDSLRSNFNATRRSTKSWVNGRWSPSGAIGASPSTFIVKVTCRSGTIITWIQLHSVESRQSSKNRVLYRKRYSKKLAKKQHLAFYECQSYEKCKCGSFRE